MIREKQKLTVESVKAALDLAGGNKAQAAHELGVSRTRLWAFIRANADLQAYDEQMIIDLHKAALLPRLIRLGKIGRQDRAAIRHIVERCNQQEARAA